MCLLEGEDDLADFMIEIDILSECKHPNVVELHEAFFIDQKLWVNIFNGAIQYVKNTDFSLNVIKLPVDWLYSYVITYAMIYGY